MGTDLSALRQELTERRKRLREVNNRSRVIQFQIFNYEDIDETRRALSEHLMVERKMQETHRDERASVTAERVEQLVREVYQLEKQRVEGHPDAEAAEQRLGVERQRAERALAREELEAEQHERLVRERELALARSSDAKPAPDDSAAEARELSERGDRLAAAISAVRAELDAVVGRERDEVHEILGLLESEQRATEETQNACRELEAELARAESVADGLRRRTSDLRRIATLAAADAGTRDLPGAVGAVNLPAGESLSDAMAALTERPSAGPPPPPLEEKLELTEFTRRLLHGDRIVKLPRFATVTFAEPRLAQGLMKVDTLQQLRELVPLELRDQLISDLHGFYRRDLIDLVPVEGP